MISPNPSLPRWDTRTRRDPIPRPAFRRLRGYAFDPSLSLRMDTALVNEVVFKVPWEPSPPRNGSASGVAPPERLLRGPVGEYVEVIDYDPASGCFYEPVDLDKPEVLAQDGLAPTEGNPQFHQQMVYAVAMTTIRNFERALGRPALWAPRPWREIAEEPSADNGFVQRLRIYPHALREANAYYSPAKKALLFGYFPAEPRGDGGLLPGGIFDLNTLSLRYSIPKSIDNPDRLEAQRQYRRDGRAASLRATYFADCAMSEQEEPFALLHREL